MALPHAIGALKPTLPTWEELGTSSRSSAILLLFIPPQSHKNDSRVILTRRSLEVRSHRGQIGFPGGRRETHDKTPWDTATRETQEELGIEREILIPLGSLPQTKALDGSLVIPVVGLANLSLDSLRPSASEVAEVFAIEWPEFIPSLCNFFAWKLFGKSRRSGVYLSHGLKIWGLTGHVLYTAELK
jgi:8-oxo-dGTP pyrophosphatase MutT (NUDIX family)